MTPTERAAVTEAIAALEWLSNFIEGTSNAISTKNGFFADVFVDEFKEERAPKAFTRIDASLASLRAVAPAPADQSDAGEKIEAVAKAMYKARHDGLSNCYPWDDTDLDRDHPGYRDGLYRDAKAAMRALEVAP